MGHYLRMRLARNEVVGVAKLKFSEISHPKYVLEPGFQQKREDGRLGDCSKPRRLKSLAVRYLNKVGCCKAAILRNQYWY